MDFPWKWLLGRAQRKEGSPGCQTRRLRSARRQLAVWVARAEPVALAAPAGPARADGCGKLVPVTAIEGNSFAILTLIVAPALLTNATSVLALNTANRFGRVVDRSRQLALEIEQGIADADRKVRRGRQLERLGQRAVLLIKAQTNLYRAIGLFVAAALISVIGAMLAGRSSIAYHVAGLLGLFTGIGAAGSLATGCLLIVRETRLALVNLEDEAAVTAALLRG